ncbi:MAG: bifunctional RNase H/acid phosphatase [Sciscionella sp.]
MSERVVVEADGGSRGNPGPAGYGAVVRSASSGEVLAERLAALGNTTNNVAEYSGLIAGLEAARDLGASIVDVRMDSKLVVEQMSGRWKIKNQRLQPLALRAGELIRGFARVSFEWIPREQNKYADRLANEAMDAKAKGTRPRAAGFTAEDGAAESDQEVDQESDQEVDQAETASPGAWMGSLGAPTRLLLLRHGQTELSAARRYSGRGNPELTELGARQAKAAATRLSTVDAPAAVVSSPLSRALRTAREVATAVGLQPVVDDGLIELDFGAWEGLTFAEAAERDPEAHRRWLADPMMPIPGGESLEAVHRRVRRVRDELLARYRGQTVIVVSHVTPIKTLLRMALDTGPAIFYRLHLDLASLSIVEFYVDGHSSVRLVNDTSHLT